MSLDSYGLRHMNLDIYLIECKILTSKVGKEFKKMKNKKKTKNTYSMIRMLLLCPFSSMKLMKWK